jgi:2-hydroxychromene-2-carboxylate isomerase
VKISVIETWLNSTLREAEFFGIPCSFSRSKKTTTLALFDYAIDRVTLEAAGVSDVYIDKLYRALFVNTMGFYSLINEIIYK